MSKGKSKSWTRCTAARDSGRRPNPIASHAAAKPRRATGTIERPERRTCAARKLLSCHPEPPMQKFDEMFTQLPAAGPIRLQAQSQSQSQGGQTQSQVQGVRGHYGEYAQWLARQAEDAM